MKKAAAETKPAIAEKNMKNAASQKPASKAVKKKAAKTPAPAILAAGAGQ